jgi:hypothetical protein
MRPETRKIQNGLDLFLQRTSFKSIQQFRGHLMNSSYFFSLIFLAFVCFSGMGCQKQALVDQASLTKVEIAAIGTDPLRTGYWGAVANSGQSKFLQGLFSVTDSGAQLDFGCGLGTVIGQIRVNQAGEFNVDGNYQNEGGATPEGGYPSRYMNLRGLVSGNQLILNIYLEGNEPFSMTFNYEQTGSLLRCL